MKWIAIPSILLFCCQVDAQRNFMTRAYDVILEALGFGQCTNNPPRCGYRQRGYRMIQIDKDRPGSCTEICSTRPYVSFGYQCGTCQVLCPETATVPCLQGLGMKMFRIDTDGTCNDICIFSSTRTSDEYECGDCSNAVPIAPQAAPRTRRPRAVPLPPVQPPLPVSAPMTKVPIASPIAVPVTAPIATSPVTSAPVPIMVTAPISNPSTLRYDITFQLVNIAPEYGAVFQEAVTLWESVVVGDLPDVASSDFDKAPMEGCTYPTTVDDLYICGTSTTIDGVGLVAGQARPTFIRSVADGRLPSAGEFLLDTADLADVKEKGLLLPLIAHEMGHVLGMQHNCRSTFSNLLYSMQIVLPLANIFFLGMFKRDWLDMGIFRCDRY
jgi:hypothetical protein